MKITHIMTYVMSAVFIVGETSRRGFEYFSINATTMFEDYFCGLLLLTAAVLWSKKHTKAHMFMVAAWGYATGGMFVPFFAHLEAFIRGVTLRSDHPHGDINAVILKGVIWGICLVCFISTLRSKQNERS